MSELEKKSLAKNLDRYIRKMLLQYSVTGQFPDGWQSEDFDHYLAQEGYSLRCILLYTGKQSALREDRLKLELTINEFIPNGSVKIYKSYIFILLFENQCVFSPQYVCQTIKKLLALPNKQKIQQHISEPFSFVSGLCATYQRLYAAAIGNQSDTHPRFIQLVNLYELEDNLYDKIFECDSDEIRNVMNIIAEVVGKVDFDNTVNCCAYFSFLWRNVERVIFHQFGRRKTTVEKLITDEELANCGTALQMSDVVYSFIISYIDQLELGNQVNYNKIISRAKDMIKGKCNENLTLEHIAKEIGLSQTYLSKLFKKVEGITFKEFIIRVRMEKAKHLLSIGLLNINQVAAATGYTDSGYFCRAFKAYWGMTPKQFQLRI